MGVYVVITTPASPSDLALAARLIKPDHHYRAATITLPSGATTAAWTAPAARTAKRIPPKPRKRKVQR
jgi:hypothetical protein